MPLSMISGNIRLLWKRKSTSSLKLRFKVSKPTFLIQVDKETEDPELRVEDFIHLQHFAEITNTKGPTLVDAAYAAKLHKIELIANHRDGKFWIVQKP